MRLISHRGNIYGPNPLKENSPDYINETLSYGYDVEIDIWFIENKWYLGHDEPVYQTDYIFLKNTKLWCHAKNYQALETFYKSKDINYFWHDKDTYTITSNGFVWCNINAPLLYNSICVIPEKGINGNIDICYGVCSDYIENYKK